MHRPSATRRRSLAMRALTAIATAFLGMSAVAQSYPSRPLQLIVPFPAGGTIDAVGRSFAQALDGKINQRVVVVNRDGGSTTVGMNALLSAPADGYTVVYGTSSALTVLPHFMKGLQFKADSFTPVCQTFENIFVLAVRPDSRFENLNAVLAEARARPGRLTYGHPGVSSGPHLAGADLFQRAGVTAIDVPFRGEAHMLPTLMGGEVDVVIVTIAFASAHRLKVLAAFSDVRVEQFPDAPTARELGHPVSPLGYGGLFVRAETPAHVVAILEKGCRDVTADVAFREFAQRQNLRTSYQDAAKFSSRIKADSRTMESLLKTLKLER